MALNLQDKFIPIDAQTDHQVVHLNRLGKTNRFVHQPLDSGVEGQVFTLDFLRIPFTWLVLIGIQMTRICTPVIRVISRNAERFQERFQLYKNLVLAAPKDVRQHLASVVIKRMPKSPLLVLAPWHFATMRVIQKSQA